MDKITLKQAMETDVWLMVYAAEPNRNINVQMTYDDLWRIRRWIENLLKNTCEENNDLE